MCYGLNFSGTLYGLIDGSCEHSNMHPGFMNYWLGFEHLQAVGFSRKAGLSEVSYVMYRIPVQSMLQLFG
jgi:hypothetical protein